MKSKYIFAAAVATIGLIFVVFVLVSFSNRVNNFSEKSETPEYEEDVLNPSSISVSPSLAPTVFFDDTVETEIPTRSPTIFSNPDLNYEIFDIFHHDNTAFTQGLIYVDGWLYESTGLYGGFSSLRKVRPETGEVVQIIITDEVIEGSESYFAEGLCLIGGTLHQLTWREDVMFLFDLHSFELMSTIPFETTRNEGWGIAYSESSEFDEPVLVVSDGSSYIHFWDPLTYEEINKIQVTFKNIPVHDLNELEFYKGDLLANIWYDDRIARIDIKTGEIIQFYDFGWENLPFDKIPGENVLNGIAYDEENDVVYVTGKRWHNMLRVKLFDN